MWRGFGHIWQLTREVAMLGVLGGMGPAATLDFLGKVVANTPAGCDQDHVPMSVLFATEIPDRTAAILGFGEDPLPALRKALRTLEQGHVSVIAMPCNTAHYWHEQLQAEAGVPILHIVDAVATMLPIATERVGVLATPGTLRAGIYPDRLQRRRIRCAFPTDGGQAEVSRAIALVKAGDIADARAILVEQAGVLLDGGCDAIIMGCTEIPVALAGVAWPTLVDPTDALARAAVDFCLGERRALAA
jgi:aspartate racemase